MQGSLSTFLRNESQKGTYLPKHIFRRNITVYAHLILQCRKGSFLRGDYSQHTTMIMEGSTKTI